MAVHKTLNRHYPYPDGDEVPDIGVWTQTLAEAIDEDAQAIEGTLAAVFGTKQRNAQDSFQPGKWVWLWGYTTPDIPAGLYRIEADWYVCTRADTSIFYQISAAGAVLKTRGSTSPPAGRFDYRTIGEFYRHVGGPLNLLLEGKSDVAVADVGATTEVRYHRIGN